MPAANAAKRRVNEKHRLKRMKAKAAKRKLDTSNPFWRLLLSKDAAQITPAPARAARMPR